MSGDGSTAAARCTEVVGRVVISPGNDNAGAVVGDGSTATAGPINNNTATVTGDGLDAVAVGDNVQVTCPPTCG